jgi:nucleotide-binding universal stress UspA family protein
MKKPIIVGVNGSTASEAAMEWALERAIDRHLPVVAVHAVDDRWVSPEFQYHDLIRDRGMELLKQVQADAALKAPGADVQIQLHYGSPGAVLREQSEQASMMVIGSHKRYWPDGGPVTDRALQIVTASDCPVAVIPRQYAPGNRGVVVGVDGSEESLQAVAFAAAEADREGDELTAVLALGRSARWIEREMPASGLAEVIEEEDNIVLAESVAGLRSTFPGLVVHQRLVSNLDPAQALVEEAATARILVIGSRGRGAFTRLILGSTAHAVLLRVPCPTVVTRLHKVKHED